jgi:hypothetical protein
VHRKPEVGRNADRMVEAGLAKLKAEGTWGGVEPTMGRGV